MLKYNNININKVYKGTELVKKVQINSSTSYIYIIDESEPVACPDVVSTMTGYDGTANEVYAQDAEKWYMRNNLGLYEEYGIMEEVNSLASATYYDGKLVIFNAHEYEYNGGWNDLGATTATTRTIQSPSYISRTSSNYWEIPVDYTANTDTKFTMGVKSTNNGGAAIIGSTGSSDSNDYRVFMSARRYYYDVVNGRIYTTTSTGMLDTWARLEFGNYYIKDLATGSNLVTGSTMTFQRQDTMVLGYGDSDTFDISALTMYHGSEKVRDFIPAIDNGEICLYDKVSEQYFKTRNNIYPLSGGTITQVEVSGGIVYPKDYAEKAEPEDNVTVSSLDEIACPYEGMTAIVDEQAYRYTNGQWQETERDWSREYLTFKALESGTFSFSGNSVDYSLDNGKTWTILASNTPTPTVNAGNSIMFKAEITPSSSIGVGTFSSTGRYEAMGNPYSLLYGDNFVGVTDISAKTYALYRLFYNSSNLVSAEKLSLPATTLANFCYYYMFYACTSLTTAPELPATKMASYCYDAMFMTCTALTTTQNVLTFNASGATACFADMFRRCKSLTKTVYLQPNGSNPAYGASGYCRNMYAECTSLTQIQNLPPVQLSGTLGVIGSAPSAYTGMFSGCTSLVTAPLPQVTGLSNYCFEGMFRNCTSLTGFMGSSTRLPATTLKPYCYSYMFAGCSSLVNVPVLPATRLTGAQYCYNRMFHSCTSLTVAPELPATTLVNYGYNLMFYGCTSLVNAPDLPATTLTNQCYEGMFQNSGVQRIKYMALSEPSSTYTYNWADGLPSTGTFIKNANATWTNTFGASAIPTGWTVETATP